MATITSSPVAASSLLESARAMRQDLAERAPHAEQMRCLPAQTINELQDAGLFRSVLPRRCGGSGIRLIDTIEIAAELARGCGSTAWVYTLLSSSIGGVPALLSDPEGQQEVLSNPTSRTSAVFASDKGSAKPLGNGDYVVSGNWGFASGCLHTDWFSGGVTFDDGTPGNAIMHMSEVTIKDVWHVAGMRGTGSNTVIANDVIVPARRIGRMADRAEIVSRVRPEADPSERWPFAPYFSVGLLGPVLGLADGSLELIKDGMSKRGVSFFEFEHQHDSSVLLHQLAEASMLIDGAWLHVRHAANVLDEETKLRLLDYRTRARLRAHAGYATQQLRHAMDILLNIGGGSVFGESNAVQRNWRDLNVGSRHAFANTAGILEAYGRALCDVPNITPYI
jgi:3-hydroxy-9,10-secoandrosta-1,3,5(10)-triene-9,17-dione monooxygenase